MPTPTLHNKSPYQLLFDDIPNYTKLRSFGCLCYPWLSPYATHKLSPKFTPCLVVSYSFSQSAYYCLDLLTNKIHTS